jgi:hypothetical protein
MTGIARGRDYAYRVGDKGAFDSDSDSDSVVVLRHTG